MDTQTGYISVEPGFVVTLARQLFNFEQKEPEAFELLSCFRGISNDQIRQVLIGDATLTGSQSGAIFRPTEDKSLKARIEAHERYMDSKTLMIAGCRIPADLLNQYVDETVLRLRATMAMGGFGLFMEDPLKILELEEQRQKLHNMVLVAAKVKRGTPEYHIFAQALHNYVQKRRTLIK